MAADDMLAVAVPVTTLWASPDAVRPIDAAMVVDRPDPRAWPAALREPDRRDLSRVLTQLLLGEPVQVIDEDGAWVRVSAPWQPSDLDPRGYPGWLRRAHLAAAPTEAGHEAVVVTDTTPLYRDATGPDARQDRSREATYASILPVVEPDGHGALVQVGLPGGERAWLNKSAVLVRTTPADRATRVAEPDHVVAEARRFVGLPYLWGGMSASGLDCSGLVHIVNRRLGVIVPRDAHDQAAASIQVPREQARPGDLLFYARSGKGIHHVGFALDDPDRILHAPGTGRSIVDEPMNDDRRATVLDYVGRLGRP